MKAIPGQGGFGREEHWQVLVRKVVPHGQVRTVAHLQVQSVGLNTWPLGQVVDGSGTHWQAELSHF